MKPWLVRLSLAAALAAGLASYFVFQAAAPSGTAASPPPERERRFLAGTPAGALETYLVGDFEGDRLERANWEMRYKAMVLWPQEPAWGSAYVIRDFRIHTGKTTVKDAQAEVTFETLGELDLQTFRYTPSPTRQTVPYLLQQVDNDWKIAYPTLKPHVGVEAAKAYLERMKVVYTQRKDTIEASIKALESQAAQ